MNYKTMILSALLAGSMQHAWAMHQQQPYNGGLRRISSSVVVYQSGGQPQGSVSYNNHQQGSQVRMPEHAGNNTKLLACMVQMERTIQTIVKHQNQQSNHWNQILTDVNEKLTQQAVQIGELKKKIADLEQNASNNNTK